jgi:hypothetical protein
MKNNFMHLPNKNEISDLETKNAFRWSQFTLSRLLELVEKYDKNWRLISKRIGFFCEDECENQYERLKANWCSEEWTEEEDCKLSKVMGQEGEISWFECCILMGNRSVWDCRQRWALMTSPSVITGSWGHQEQIFIFKLARDCNFSWKKMVKFLPQRNTNSVKSFFNSTIRKIKKCLVFRFLKKMISWPTYTNKSKNRFHTFF